MSGSGSYVELPENAPQPGDVLADKYRVESVLGVGGMGMVLLVRHIELGQEMAIKVMLPGVVHDDQAGMRFVREARAAAAIQSEHVVRIFDVGTFDSGLPYMVMELLRGKDLSQVLARETRLAVEDAVDYVLQASHAIAEAHARGIVHRDLKPSNLFVTTRSNGTPLVKVLDFGISKAMNLDADLPSSANLTKTSAIMGSPLYMSPEQVRNAKNVDARTDIWALGVILHELLTGAPAFTADTLPGICAAIIADNPPPLRTLREDAPAALEDVLTRCLEKNVASRYQTTKELMAALRPFASRAGRLEPTSIPAALTMRESASVAPPRPSGNGVERVTAPRSSGKMSGATSLVSSTANVASPDGPAEDGPRRGRGPALISAAVLLGAGAIGAFAWSRSAADPAAPTGSGAIATPAARRSFVLFIDSTPAGAEVLEGDDPLGHAPLQVSIDNEVARKQPRRFVVRRAGFQPYSIVQGPSEENVRIIASLVTTPEPVAVPSAVAVTPSAPAKGVKRASPRAEQDAPVAPPVASSAPAAPSPPPPPSDIRLQR
jgi:eukaryotic-like serine/threonine-protein kinase